MNKFTILLLIILITLLAIYLFRTRENLTIKNNILYPCVHNELIEREKLKGNEDKCIQLDPIRTICRNRFI